MYAAEHKSTWRVRTLVFPDPKADNTVVKSMHKRFLNFTDALDTLPLVGFISHADVGSQDGHSAAIARVLHSIGHMYIHTYIMHTYTYVTYTCM